MPYVYSTATANRVYRDYAPPAFESAIPAVTKEVLIKGGSNLAQKNTLFTPFGVATQVSDDDLAWLLAHDSFKRHMKRGFMTVSKSQEVPEKVAQSTLESGDRSAPIKPGDNAIKDPEKITTGAVKW